MNKIKIENVVFCEDVRSEVGGKHTLLGVSGPELNIIEIPGLISVALWIHGRASNIGPIDIDFRVLDHKKQAKIKGRITGETGESHTCVFVIGPMPLHIQEAGDYIFEWRPDGMKWGKIAVLRINYVPQSEVVKAPPTA